MRWYAPVRVPPRSRGARAARRAYAGACAGGPARVGARADRFALPRVDAHYLRRPGLLDRALKGRDAYLRMRHLGRGPAVCDRTTAKAEARGALGRVCRFASAALATMIAVADRRAAAFFDLDKTLMEERQRPAFARAYRAGILTRRQLARDAWENVRFRLQGSTDEKAEAVRQRVLEAMTGGPRAHVATRAGGPAGTSALRLPADAPGGVGAPMDVGRPAYIVTAASQELAELLARVLVLDGGVGTPYEVRDGHYTGRLAGPFTYRDGRRRCGCWPNASESTSRPLTPTPTRSPTCRCCVRWGTRWR